ncbi:MAG: inner membrane CreD family protein, partial [Myxococcota bacterium]
HPVQYTFVGLALVLFYLLLLSLSEHIPFVGAYVIASGACISLLGCYVRFVLGSLQRALVFSGSLVTLYGVLYFLLQQEGIALLLGSLMLFALLAGVMLVTRHVDWYALLQAPSPSEEA